MTAPTSEERREVAARLRSCAQDVNGTRDFAMYLSHWVGFDGVTDDEGKHFTIAADRKEAELTLERLADLIDPTCEMEAAGDVPALVKGSLETFFCSECGSPIYNDVNPSYCLYCGARVVSDDE